MPPLSKVWCNSLGKGEGDSDPPRFGRTINVMHASKSSSALPNFAPRARGNIILLKCRRPLHRSLHLFCHAQVPPG